MAQFQESFTPENTSFLFLQEGGHHLSAALFDGTIPPTSVIKVRRCDEPLWDHESMIEEGGRKYIVSAGFDGVLRTGYHKIDHALIIVLVERWRPETHTFHFLIGGTTITLQDVQVLRALPIDGECESQSNDEWLSKCYGFMGFVPDVEDIKNVIVKLSTLVSQLRQPYTHDELGFQQRARIYILDLLGGHLFSDARSIDVSLNFLDNLDFLAEDRQLSWGSVVLAYLYRNMCTTADEKRDVKVFMGR